MRPTRIFIMLLLMIMGVVGVKAEQLELTVANGSYATTSGNYINSWTSNTSPTITITASANNMDKRQNSNYFLWHSGQSGNSTYTMTIASGYIITGYTITAQGNSADQTITANGLSHTFTSTESSEFIVSGLESATASFVLTGANSSGLRISKITISYQAFALTASEIYTINNTNSYRGALTYDPTQSTQWIWSSGKTGATAFNANSVNCQWILYPTGDEGQYYLYNVGAQKFAMVRSDGNYGNTWAFSPSAVPVTLEPQSDGRYFIKSATGNIYMSVSNNYTGPIITYYANGDGGLPFTITKVADASSEITAQVTAAVNKLIHNTTKLSSAPTTDGWYAIKIQSRDGQTGYTNDFLYSFITEYNNSGTYYPLGHTSLAKLRPSMADATYFFHITPNGSNFQWQMPNGKYLKKNDSGKFPISTVNASDITIGFENNYTYFYNDTYADAYGNFVGETVTKGRTKYDVYPIDLTTAGLTAWKVIITGGSADTQLTCTRSDISGLTSVYNNGYFFLPTGETPLNTEFTLEGMVSCTIDTDAKTITAQYDPSIGITADGVVVTQGYQTTGQGNENALLLRMDVTPLKNITNTTLIVTLDATTQQNISSLYVYETTATEFIANIPSTKLATTDDISGTVNINLGDVSSGLHHYWLCATVKDDATLGDILDAALTSITYTTTEEKTLDVSEIGNPTRQGMKVFAQQNFVFKPTADNCRFYRIPAMILDKNGNVVVAIDRRYNSNADLGSHKIDVSVVRSTNAGKTWSNQNIVAVGNTSIEARYGYGDAALARTQSGKLICLMAPGQNNFFGTNHNGSTHYNNWVAMLTSDDNGVTWQGTSDNPTQPILLTNDVFGMGTDHSIFVSSGKGLTTADGTVMFTTNVRMPDGTLNCYILKTTDEGESWTLVPEVAYSGTDESKLEQLSDGRLILSVRQSGNRGWNFGDSDGTGWGTQYRSEDIWGNACNADIINYGREMYLGKDVLIHSYINTGGRESLQLAISINGGNSWTSVYNIQPNGSCYSTMQVLPDGTLAILYEDESYSAGNGYAINYVTITKEQILDWISDMVETMTTFHIQDASKNIWYEETVTVYGNQSDVPTSMKRGFCTYTMYSDADMTNLITEVGLYTDVYVKCEFNGPFEFSTTDDPKWYLLHSHEQKNIDANDYFANANGTTWQTTDQTDEKPLYSDKNYQWAFIGNPYALRLVNRESGKPLSAAANTGSNGSEISLAVTDDTSYPYHEFTIYGYGGVLGENDGVVDPFVLILKDSYYGFLIYNGTMKYYSSGVSITNQLELAGWRSSDLMVIEVPTTYDVNLNVVGDKSYATLYLPFDVQTDADTKAYYIAEVADGVAKLTELSEGNIPAKTAVVLINDKAATTTTLNITSDVEPVIAEEDNLLKGTLVPISLDLGDTTPYYSMGRKDGKIGFYKFNNNGTTTITLGANKAYLETGSTTLSKGFTFSFGDPSGIDQVGADVSVQMTDVIYNLSGQRVSRLTKGMYIVNGKKVVIK